MLDIELNTLQEYLGQQGKIQESVRRHERLARLYGEHGLWLPLRHRPARREARHDT